MLYLLILLFFTLKSTFFVQQNYYKNYERQYSRGKGTT
ncbi:hypothetical protein SAMN05444349_1295 [Bacteroides faecichinchillae]|uniref:Uncharacterized protein n=1 Tax=Bacteroides faecichinchillae TaxID=871325 RepID=A0A1M5DHY4_9BACE|nr:hypothetical protein SAMN05444349_1295 [Bacteroides faecichinchillae]